MFKGSCLSFPSIWTTHWWIPELPTSDVGKLGGCGPNPPQPCLASSLHVSLSPTPVHFAGAEVRSDSSARNLKCRSNWFSMGVCVWESHFMVVREAEDFIAFKSVFEQTSSQIGNLTLQRACLTVPEALQSVPT